MESILDNQFESKVIENKNISIVIFAANWNGSSQFIEDHIHEISEQNNDRVSVFKMDIESNNNIANKYWLHRFPTTLFFKNGELVELIVGVYSKTRANRIISNLLT